jgi:hypothetical protein
MRTSGTVGRQWVYSQLPATYVTHNVPFTSTTPTQIAHVRNRDIIRPYPGGTKPPRPLPHAPESWQAQITAAWKTMSPAERDAWKPIANRTQLPTPQAYTRFNFKRHNAGLPPVTVPP